MRKKAAAALAWLVPRARILGLFALYCLHKSLPTLLQMAGLVSLFAGLFLLAPWLGFLVLGLVLAAVGYMLEPDNRLKARLRKEAN